MARAVEAPEVELPGGVIHGVVANLVCSTAGVVVHVAGDIDVVPATLGQWRDVTTFVRAILLDQAILAGRLAVIASTRDAPLLAVGARIAERVRLAIGVGLTRCIDARERTGVRNARAGAARGSSGPLGARGRPARAGVSECSRTPVDSARTVSTAGQRAGQRGDRDHGRDEVTHYVERCSRALCHVKDPHRAPLSNYRSSRSVPPCATRKLDPGRSRIVREWSGTIRRPHHPVLQGFLSTSRRRAFRRCAGDRARRSGRLRR